MGECWQQKGLLWDFHPKELKDFHPKDLQDFYPKELDSDSFCTFLHLNQNIDSLYFEAYRFLKVL